MSLDGVRIALVHDWLTGMRGGEKVLECLAELFPQARLFSLFRTRELSPAIDSLSCTLSPAQRLPWLGRMYRHYLPLYPFAVERLDLSGYDLIVSTSHCVAKGAKAPPGALHVGYVFTPMRYIWDMYPAYFGPERSLFVRAAMRPIAAWLRSWDRRSCDRVDKLACISRHVAERIQRHWSRSAEVIHPPVDAGRFRIGPSGDYYLVVSALAPYKGIDLAIKAANERRFKLIVAGHGQDWERLRALAGPTVDMVGWVEDDELVELYAGCRALLFPGEEDFGITPLEAMASGKPVIALGRGGVWDSVIPINAEEAPPECRPAGRLPDPDQPPTGVFFYRSTPEALIKALDRFETERAAFDPKELRARATGFDRSVFKAEILAFLERSWAEHRANRLPF